MIQLATIVGGILLFFAAAPAAWGSDSVVVDTSQRRTAVTVTATNTGNNQLLYFTSPSLTADERHLVFISDRTGNPNLFTRDLVTGRERQLTTNTEGVLKSYVYFDGHPYRGLGKGSVSLDPRSGMTYFIQGRLVCAVTLAGRQKILAELPPDQMTAFTHVSADGTRLCVPTTDARALDGDKQLAGRPSYDIDQRVVAEKLSSYLRVFDTATGRLICCERVPQTWITHVQFSPLNSALILYNSEYCADSGIRRMWLWDGKTHLRLRTEGDGRSRLDWTCHEMWERDGQAIIYHGTYTNGVSYLGRVRPDGSDRVEIPLPAAWKRYGHFTVGQPGELVTDGYYEEPGDHQWAGAWISRLEVNWAQARIRWFPLLRHGSSWTSQDCHPHPVFNHAADAIWFTSDEGGSRAVHRLPLGG